MTENPLALEAREWAEGLMSFNLGIMPPEGELILAIADALENAERRVEEADYWKVEFFKFQSRAIKAEKKLNALLPHLRALGPLVAAMNNGRIHLIDTPIQLLNARPALEALVKMAEEARP